MYYYTKLGRREFVKGASGLVGGAAAASVLNACSPIPGDLAMESLGDAAATPVATKTTKRNRLHVDYEWDPLREVVVGYPHIRIGHAFPAAAFNYTAGTTIAAGLLLTTAFYGETLEQAMPDLHAQAVEQMNAAIAILTNRGIVVHQILPPEPAEEAYLADIAGGNNMLYFPRDPIVVIGDKYIETAPFYPARRGERFPIRRTLGARLDGCRVMALPEPAPLPEDDNGGWGPGPFLEGGDVFVLGPDIYVGHTGNASNSAGIACLRSILGDGYRVHEIRLSPDFLHLDCVLSTPRPGLAIICRDGFIDGLPEFLRDWQLIEVSAADAEAKLATNILVLDQQTDLVAAESPEIAEALARAGQTVLTTPFSAIFTWGGAFRCWHHPLIRAAA